MSTSFTPPRACTTIRVRRDGPVAVAVLTLLLALLAPPLRAQQAEPPPRTHVVQRGETLYSLARRYGLTVAELQRLNDLRDTTIRVGQRLVVGSRPKAPPPAEPARPPDAAPEPGDPSESAPERADVTRPPPAAGAPIHAVRPGDTFYTLALRYGVPVDTLRALNPEHGLVLHPGTAVRLPAAFGPVEYEAGAGETLAAVARRYELPLVAVRDVNPAAPDTLTAGATLRIPARRVPVVLTPGTLPPPDTTGALGSYPATFAGRPTAGGEPYDPARATAAHPDLPFGTVLLLTNPATGRRTFAVVNDRGPVEPSMLLDVSDAVLEALGMTEEPRPDVELHVIE